MSITINDLKPKNFKVKVGELELEATPPRLSHALSINKVVPLLSDASGATLDEINEAQRITDIIIAELIPDLKDIQLDYVTTVEVLEQILDSVVPDDNKVLEEKGVKFDTDPKAEKIG